MKISAIDIGSNSVRLAMFQGGKTLYKRLKTTRLGEGLSFTGSLKPEAVERSAQAVAEFLKQAQEDGAEKVYAFATAAVRSSSNGCDFVKRVRELCGLNVEVLSGQEEAECGILGALGNSDGGIIDVGGASTEVTLRKNGERIYSESVNIGTVRLYDCAGRNRQELQKIIDEKLTAYGDFSAADLKMYAIGGTASRLASVKHNLTSYRPEITDGTKINIREMETLADRLLTMSVEEIRATTICRNSADIVGGGCLLMLGVMKKFGVNEITVSERDNLEGFVILKEGAL